MVRTNGAMAPVCDPDLTTMKCTFPTRGKLAKQDSLQRHCWIGPAILPSSVRQNGVISPSWHEWSLAGSQFLFSPRLVFILTVMSWATRAVAIA